MIVLSLLIGLLSVVLLLPTVSDLLSLARIAFGGSRRRSPATGERPRLLFLVPAHDEELLIEPCVRSLVGLQYPAGRASVVVIADNCSDRTPELARAAGARCLERQDKVLRGKPRAIAWALEQVALRDYDAVVIVDADTVVRPDFANQIATIAPLGAKAAQAFFDVSNPEETPLTRMSAVLATSMHRFAYPLKQRAGLNVPLVGNGMCFGTGVLAEHGWHAFSICEDWEMYALLSERGVPIESLANAHVYSQEARSLSQSSTQRQRWTAGRLTVLARVGPRILRSPLIGWRQKFDAIAELTAPGPALHLAGAVLAAGIAIVLHVPGSPLLVGALVGSLVRPVIYTTIAIAEQPHPVRTLRAFAFLPFYAVWRIGAAVRALRMLGDKPWVRTERHEHGG